MKAILCGGTPSPHDLAVIQEFAAALQLPTDRERRLALLELSGVDTTPWREQETDRG